MKNILDLIIALILFWIMQILISKLIREILNQDKEKGENND